MNVHLPYDAAQRRSDSPRPRPAMHRNEYKRFHPRYVVLDAAPRSRFAKPGRLLILVAVLLTIGAAFFIRLPVVEPAIGMVIPAGSTIDVRTTISGEVASLDVTEGSTVLKDAVLLALDSSV